MSTRLHSERTIEWQCTAGAICTASFSLDTGDPLARVTRVPGPTLHIVFGGRADGDIALVSAPAANPPMRSAATAPTIEQPPAPPHPQRIELSIDSLPNFTLVEAIPVAIDPVGDTAFTAWVPNLDTNATGHSVFEALLLLKDRIEAVYDDLNRRAHLSNEQRTTLQMLHTYIAPKKPEWM